MRNKETEQPKNDTNFGFTVTLCNTLKVLKLFQWLLMMPENFETGEDLFRHQCLVRWLIKYRIQNRSLAHEWLNKWNNNHPGSKLEADTKDQWGKGNRGEHGDWR